MADAAFEAILGTVLILGVAFGHIDNRDFPDPGTDAVIALFGLALIGLGVVLASLVRRDLLGDRVLRPLAATNAGFAALIAVWVLAADGFSSAGRAVIWVTVVALGLLAAAQARLLGNPA